MDSFCFISGDYPCNCPIKGAVTPLGSALLVDLKAVIRKIFTDHAVYTNWLIGDSLPSPRENIQPVITRLLRNPQDISNILEPIVGKEKSNVLGQLFTDHLILAATNLQSLSTPEYKSVIGQFLANGDQIGNALANLNPHKLSADYAQKLMREHNEFLLKLISLRRTNNITEYINTYDNYYKHILMLADTIYETLTI